MVGRFNTSTRHTKTTHHTNLAQTLIGNSLGKLHIPIRLDEDVFKAIQKYSSNNVDLLNEWYQHNAEGHTYTLRRTYR